MKRDIELEIQLTELKFKIEGEDRKAKAEKELLYLEIPNLNHLVQDQLETIAKDIKCIKSNDLDKIIEDQDFRYTQ